MCPWSSHKHSFPPPSPQLSEEETRHFADITFSLPNNSNKTGQEDDDDDDPLKQEPQYFDYNLVVMVSRCG